MDGGRGDSMKPAVFSAKVKAVAPSCLTIGASLAEGARGLAKIGAWRGLPCTLSPDLFTSSLSKSYSPCKVVRASLWVLTPAVEATSVSSNRSCF